MGRQTSGGCHCTGEELIVGVYRPHGVWPMDGSTGCLQIWQNEIP